MDDGIFGIITLSNEEFDRFKNDIDDLLKKNSYINNNENDFKNFTYYSSNACICNIQKIELPNWKNNIIYNEVEISLTNQTYYRFVIIKYRESEYYFEKNGSINLNFILKKYSFFNFSKNLWKNINTEVKNENYLNSFKDKINNYLINNIIKEISEEISNNSNFKNFNIDLNILNLHLCTFKTPIKRTLRQYN